MTDLTMIQEGNPDSNDNGLINFHKRTLIYKVISEIELFQLGTYPPVKNPNLISNLEAIRKNQNPNQKEIDDTLFAASLIREPRKIDNKRMLL